MIFRLQHKEYDFRYLNLGPAETYEGLNMCEIQSSVMSSVSEFDDLDNYSVEELELIGYSIYRDLHLDKGLIIQALVKLEALEV